MRPSTRLPTMTLVVGLRIRGAMMFSCSSSARSHSTSSVTLPFLTRRYGADEEAVLIDAR
jgi:hypothetical protein